MACRRAGVYATGLYVIITRDEDEMRHELAGYDRESTQ
jgi:hypothetical protein